MSRRFNNFHALVLLLIMAVPTAVFAVFQSQAKVDTQNEAMRSIGTEESRSVQRRIDEFGADIAIVVALEWIGDNTDRPSLRRLVAELGKLEQVKWVLPFPGAPADYPAFAVLLETDKGNGWLTDAVHAVSKTAHRYKPPEAHLHMTGQPAGELAIAEAMNEEKERVMPLITVVLLLLLLLFYRHVGLALAGLLPAGVGVIWTSGIYVLMGYTLDPISSLLQPVLLTVGVAGSVHLIESFLQHRVASRGTADAAKSAVRDILTPAFLAVFTTAAGFMALTTSNIPAVIRFGVFSACGVVLTCLLTLSIAPALLTLFARSPRLTKLRKKNQGKAELSRRYTAWIKLRRHAIVLLTGILCLASSLVLPGLRVDDHPVGVLPERHAFRRNLDEMAMRLGGVETFDVLIPSGKVHRDKVRQLASEIAKNRQVSRLVGFPRSAPNGDVLLTALLKPSGSEARERLFDKVEHEASMLGLPKARATGTSVRIARDSGRLIRRQLLGIGLMLGILFAVFSIAFRSIKTALLGLLPNILPCLLLYGSMAAMDRPLSVSSSMIGSVMLGLVVDDTIHFLYRFHEAHREQSSRAVAISQALRRAGSAILVTSTTLCCGFAGAAFGSLRTTREFGTLAAATILIALIADLVLLPALIVLQKNRGPALAVRAASPSTEF